MFERTSTRPLFDRSSRSPSRPHALPRLLQVVVSASTTVDHWNIPNCRGEAVGTTATLNRRSPFDPGQIAEASQGQGSRRYRISTLPTVIAHGGDFAPTPIAPGASCREHGSLPLSGATWGECDVAVAARTCKVRAARGSCGVRLPRRRRTLTNPRRLLPAGPPAMRASSAPLSGSRSLPDGRACAFFTIQVTVARDTRTGPDGSALRRGRVANHSIDDGPQRP
jgi:hypothetical protein